MESGSRMVDTLNGMDPPSANPESGQRLVAPQPDPGAGRPTALRVRPLAELLNCPPAVGVLLTGVTQSMQVEAGAVVFRQSDVCRGLYVVIAGQFVRRTERRDKRLNLGPARPGDLVELAAALGDGRHNYTLTALVEGAMLLLPLHALVQAFEAYPPLRMQLLEELAREVSRAYCASIQSRMAIERRRGQELRQA